MKRFFGVAAAVIILAGLAGGAYLRFIRPQVAPAAANVATGTVQRGTLAATVNAAGNITAHQAADLSFGQNGTVRKINVQVGSRVKAGDLLAELDTSDLNLQLRNAQVNLKVQQAKLAQTKNPTTAQDVANARAQLDAAQASYDKAGAGSSANDIATAEAQVRSAQAAYDAAVKSAGSSSSQLVSASAALEKARLTLEQAQGSYDKIAWRGDVGGSSQAQTLQTATIDYNTAKANYDALAATASTDANSKIAQAASSLQSAQANLAKLKTPVTQADLASAQAQLTQAKNNLDKLLAGPDANALDIAQSAVEQAEISLDQARLKLQQAEIVAPFDGIVTAVNVRLGQSAANNAMQIADLDHLEIVVNMAEVDVNRAAVGQPAQVTLDALPDATLEGTVSQIAPAGVQTQGVVNYPVTVALNNPPAGVKTGMTANLNIIVEQRDNVLMAPNRAVRTQGRQKYVTVLYQGLQIPVPVQTGLSNDTMTEVTGSGLQEGDQVVLTSTTTAQGGGGLGGFGRIAGPAIGR